MTRAVEDVLEEIHAGSSPRMLVLNKADIIDEERRRELSFRHADAVLVSAVTGEGLEELKERITQEFERTLKDVELLVPFAEGGLLSELHDVAGDMEREDTPEGVRVTARHPRGRRRPLRPLLGQRPLEPNPFAPRSSPPSGSESTTTSSGATHGTTSSCAIRSPAAASNTSVPWLIRITRSSPR